MPIAAVKRDTGLGTDTLRVWEKRYGFPQPLRDHCGDRLYPPEQVEKLRVVKRLLDAGHRPGRIVNLHLEELIRLSQKNEREGACIETPPNGLGELKAYMALIKSHKAEEFRETMARLLLTKGLQRFLIEVVAPMNTLVGDAWARSYFEVFEEHLYTECIQVILRNAISTLARSQKAPRILLTTFPGESHALGLLMAECLFAMEGAHCLSLGVQTPIPDIVMAVKSQHIHIVALSFSSVQSSMGVLDSIAELKRQLPALTQIWCGGASSALRRKTTDDFVLLQSLNDISASIKNWRQQHSQAGLPESGGC
ncbi:MAG: MerR family transcriptional regulator [Limnobacter sp.]|nr:MerR family transcriptional regulator [Limnobacter sp.]